MIYLDHNATSPLKPAARDAMMAALHVVGNPSSVHSAGRAARQRVNEARASVATLVGVAPRQVIFTGSGTEANALALRGIAATSLVTSSIEHNSVIANSEGAQRLPVTAQGAVDVDAAARILAAARRGSLLSVMLVNNETGVIQPVAELVLLAKQYGHLVHVDAVQALGKITVNFAALGCDALSLSAHKIGGPQGVGALIVSDTLPLKPLIAGGGQEMNRRAGTENVAGIVGFGVAAKLAADDLVKAPGLADLRDALQQKLLEAAGQDAVIIGADTTRVANTLCIAMRGVPAETQLMAMDLAGVAVSSGSACSSGKVKASHVLQAMGLPADCVGSALRFSLGWNTTEADITAAAAAWIALYKRVCAGKNPNAA